MTLNMSQCNVHIYTNESKFPKFPFIHYIRLTNFYSCEHCHNIPNNGDTFKVFYILRTHFYTIHKYIINEDNFIHISALINNSYTKTSKCTDVKTIFSHNLS